MLACISRDPNAERTMEAFDAAIKWALDGEFTQQDIDESKLAVFSQVKYIHNISLRPRNYVVLGLLFAHCLGQASAWTMS